jgi:hypothetical protein
MHVADPHAAPRPGRRDDVIHVIVRVEDDGSMSVRSPQVPGLAYGAASTARVRSELDGVLAFALDRQGPFRVVEHHERRFEIAGREIVVRLAVDDHHDERQETYERLARAVGAPDQSAALLAAPADVVGEALYLCVVPSDRVRWIAAQLDPGSSATLAVAIAEGLLLTYQVHSEASPGRGDGETVADIMRTRSIVQPVVRDLAL